MDSTLFNIVTHLVKKLQKQAQTQLENEIEAKRVDFKAMEIVAYLLRDMDSDRKDRYENILLSHFNIMVKALEELRKEERHKRQKNNLKNKLSQDDHDNHP